MKVGEEEIRRHTVESRVQVEKERTGSGDSNAKKEGMKKSDKKGEDDTGWRRLIGSPQFQIFFHQKATNLKYKSLLWKMTCKDKGCYESLGHLVRGRGIRKSCSCATFVSQEEEGGKGRIRRTGRVEREENRGMNREWEGGGRGQGGWGWMRKEG